LPVELALNTDQKSVSHQTISPNFDARLFALSFSVNLNVHEWFVLENDIACNERQQHVSQKNTYAGKLLKFERQDLTIDF